MKKQKLYEYEIEYVYLGKQNSESCDNGQKHYCDVVATCVSEARHTFFTKICPSVCIDGQFVWITDTLEIPQS